LLKVKIFDEEHEKDLEDSINSFLKDKPEHIVQDIKFQVAVSADDVENVYCFSAMVVYKE
jgi:hypothetical protein